MSVYMLCMCDIDSLLFFCVQGHKMYESMPPLPEDGPVPDNEPLDAGSDDEMASLATAHTPEADEGDAEV